MTKASEQVAKIIEAAEKAAYKRGWDECAAAINDAAARVKLPMTSEPKAAEMPIKKTGIGIPKQKKPATKRKRRSRIRRGTAEKTVLDAVAQNPGIKGPTKVAEVLDGKVNKHTVRTVLRRADKRGLIEQRDGGLYVKENYRHAA